MATEKPHKITNMLAIVPLILELDRHNYDEWRELFSSHFADYGVANHLTSLIKKPTNLSDAEWFRIDNIVKSWIYGTLSQTLLNTIQIPGALAHVVWMTLEKLFRDNKDFKTFQLDSEIRNITMGDSTLHAYCIHIKRIFDLLENLDRSVLEKNLVCI